ncbi:MAG: 4Fe-4S binding protein [Chloroflexi bacterium]|nr:4Fe-4S binding protein [Chloroflexota bacterium]
MYGLGLIKGLSVTLSRFIESYTEDFRWLFNRYGKVEFRSSKDTRGTFTVQYPEERLIIPEEFRYVPFLVYDEGENGEKNIRCTSCGICAKACPPQCIWIVRTSDPVTGRPLPQPAEFYIDADVCMNCGFCAEYCPFDAIKMDHDFEIASYGRSLLNKERLMKPASYYASIRPKNNAREEAARAEKAAAKAAKA